MKNIIQIITLLLIITCCTESKKNLSTREIAISLIEKEYKVDGRKLEYSQIDSTDAEIRGYFISRIYINNDDSIKAENFHLNYNKDKIEKQMCFDVEFNLYKALLINGMIFTNDIKEDSKRIKKINGEYYGINTKRQQQYIDSISKIEGQNNKY